MARSKKPIARHFDAPKTCGGKLCFATRRDAEMVVVEKNITDPELELDVYRCPSRGYFHLTRRKAKDPWDQPA